jgi:magnesium transporter
MSTELLAVSETWSVAEVTEEVRRRTAGGADVEAVFVVDGERHLQGWVGLKDLLLSPPERLLRDLMRRDVLFVPADADQEEVARIMSRYDLSLLAVVDTEGHLAGAVRIADVVDVMRKEAQEDLQHAGGGSGGEEPTDSVLRVVASRLPWLLAGLLGAGLCAVVIGWFEGALERALILAVFIPIVSATAANASIQSSVIAVQGLARGELWSGDLPRRLLKELVVALFNGLVVALVLGAVVVCVSLLTTVDDPWHLAVTAGLSVASVIVLATAIGVLVPLFLHRLGVDPALAIGPFATTGNGALAVLVFFVAASLLYLS